MTSNKIGKSEIREGVLRFPNDVWVVGGKHKTLVLTPANPRTNSEPPTNP